MEISEDEIKRLRFDEKKTYQEIANIFGCSRQNIQQRLSKYNISFDCAIQRHDKRRKFISENSNLSNEEIANRLGISINTVSHKRSTLGLPRFSFVNYFWDNVDISDIDSCWNWKRATSQHGYGRISHKLKYSHRLAWVKTFGEIPEGMHVLHKCDNPLCCNPNHLFLGTHQDNMRDRNKKGRCAKNTLTIEEVKEIKRKLKDNHKTRKLSEEYNVSYYIIYNIKTGRTYKYV